MANITSVLNQLQQERNRLTYQIDRLNRAISALKGASNNRMGRGISEAGRARIAAAQRARWAKARGQKIVSINGRRRRKISTTRWPTFARLRRPVGQSGESSKRRPEQVDYGLFPLWSGRVSGLPDALGTACGGRVSQLRLYGFRLIVSFVVPQ
jgi:hypothetical protein